MRPLITLFALLLLALSHPAYAERGLSVTHSGSTGKRIALVIGNGKYQYTDSLPKLANPPHDAEDIAKALRGFGFEVIEKKDLNLEGMNEAITEFGRKIADSEAALFYYAGHGLQVKGQNYLVPVNAKIESESQVPYQSINVNQLLDEMDNGKSRANIVMLDACRNNPISGKFRSGATRGLAAISSQPKGTVIVYATDPGNVAADGNGRNGLFTAGLLTAFKGSDLSLRGVLVRTSKEVERGSDKKQTPYINGPATLQEEFRFGKGTQLASLEPVPTPPSAQSKSKEQIEDDTWKAAEGANTLGVYEAYLSGYPTGRYAAQAKVKIAILKTSGASTSKPESVVKPTQAAQQAKQEREAAARQQAEAVQEQQRQAAIRKAEAEMKPGKVFKDCADCPDMVILPAGSFTMGSSKGGAESPAHNVTIRQPFALGKTEITRGQFAAFVNATSYDAGNECYALKGDKWEKSSGNNWRNPGYQQDDSHPVACINWNDAKAYVEWLSRKTGKPYQLPTEAQWEYACRAGGQHEYCGSDNIDSIAWYGRKNGDTTHPSAQKQANGYGLYDMSGNVWEWTADSYHDSYNGAPSDGTEWQGDGAKRVLRGGSWYDGPNLTRSANRDNYGSPAYRGYYIGFRVTRTLP